MMEAKIKKRVIWFLAVVIGVPICMLLYFKPWKITGETEFSLIDKIGKLGPIGDFIGGTITPFVTIASFIVIVIAYITQSRELLETKRQVKLQVDELTLTRTVFATQKFETTFFNLLSHLSIIRENVKQYTLSFTDEGEPEFDKIGNPLYRVLKGRAAFQEVNLKIRSSLQPNSSSNVSMVFESLLVNDFEQYYRTLSVVLRFIEKDNISEDTIYFDILKSYMSDEEIIFIFYLLLKSNINDDIKKYLFKSQIAESIPKGKLVSKDDYDEYLTIRKKLI